MTNCSLADLRCRSLCHAFSHAFWLRLRSPPGAPYRATPPPALPHALDPPGGPRRNASRAFAAIGANSASSHGAFFATARPARPQIPRP
eukprot:30879-Pelagococcus_subviridis.AAC.2